MNVRRSLAAGFLALAAAAGRCGPGAVPPATASAPAAFVVPATWPAMPVAPARRMGPGEEMDLDEEIWREIGGMVEHDTQG